MISPEEFFQTMTESACVGRCTITVTLHFALDLAAPMQFVFGTGMRKAFALFMEGAPAHAEKVGHTGKLKLVVTCSCGRDPEEVDL